jgi:hypothetical protein
MLRGASECAYCGKVPAATHDHVVPRCLFEAPLPLNMITVPACSACNAAKAKHDTFLRDFLVCGEDWPPHQVADSLRDGPYRRAVTRNQSELGKAIHAGTFETHAYAMNGIDMGKLLKIPFGQGPVKHAITYIVRGLYYKLQNKRLPEDHAFLVGGIGDSAACIKTLRYLQSHGPIGVAAIGEPHFEAFSSFCATWCTEEDGKFFATLWGLAFYDRMHIGCITLPRSKMDRINPMYVQHFGG